VCTHKDCFAINGGYARVVDSAKSQILQTALLLGIVYDVAEREHFASRSDGLFGFADSRHDSETEARM
jgi:hypothetical protein